jgi:hypothetical protein
MAKLWKVIDGEPFLINPHLAIVGNPKKGQKMAARRRRRGRKNAPRRRASISKSININRPRRRRSRARRNPFTVPGVALAANPRRRRHHRKNSPARRYRRNPAVLGMQIPSLQTVGFVAAGFVGTPILEGFIASFVPVSFSTSTIGKYVIRIGSMLGLSWAARAGFGRERGNAVAIGSGVYILTSLIKDFVPGIVPGLGLPGAGMAAYQTRLSAYQSRLSQYKGMASMPRGLSAPAFGAQNTTDSARNGAMNTVALRFRRFQ